ncbi:MAG: metallophosphoesterase family protein, partial [Candidatus Micrarchaeia archaeon]
IWNSQVAPGDTVYVLGDLTFGNFSQTQQIISSLNGRIVLIRGNHDRRSSSWYRRLGIEVIEGPVIFSDLIVLSHYPRYPSLLRRLYYRLFDRSMLRYLERHIMNHDNYLIVHGHVHNRWRFDRLQYQLNVGWDAWHRLVNLKEIEEVISLRRR